MNYVTIFEIAKQDFPWWFVSLGLIAFCIGLIVFFFVPLLRAKFVAAAFMILGLGWSLLSYSSARRQFTSYHASYAKGNFSVIEGKVENFVPMLPNGHSAERFTLGRIKFSYAEGIITPCFHHTQPHGGPMRDGLQVRISYVDDCILKLEVVQ